ncbi:hypothetical protein L0O91_15385 [Clostridium perfringens]|nr:hypothetical protein [Clostridium perfringens]MCG4546504.1 hypothetical protein [Clostridium perfringens]MCG4553874.1 hypothetical protein [Clostridium perfringens]MCG4554910.1 hypothetical protein [Clostridium perfringens]
MSCRRAKKEQNRR